MSKLGDVNVCHPGGPAILADNDEWIPTERGRLVSRKRYPKLYQRIGMTYADEDERCCNAELFPLPNV